MSIEAGSDYWTSDDHEASDLFEGELSLGVTVGEVAEGGGLVFQFNEDRFRHTMVIGRTGSGKSNHLQQMEREDVRSGAGVAIIAAHEEDALYASELAAFSEEAAAAAEPETPRRRKKHKKRKNRKRRRLTAIINSCILGENRNAFFTL